MLFYVVCVGMYGCVFGWWKHRCGGECRRFEHDDNRFCVAKEYAYKLI
jgi:hypothetical protein